MFYFIFFSLRLSLPQHDVHDVVFTAQNTYDLSNLGHGQTIKLDNVLTNVNGWYSAGTGVFTYHKCLHLPSPSEPMSTIILVGYTF